MQRKKRQKISVFFEKKKNTFLEETKRNIDIQSNSVDWFKRRERKKNQFKYSIFHIPIWKLVPLIETCLKC